MRGSPFLCLRSIVADSSALESKSANLGINQSIFASEDETSDYLASTLFPSFARIEGFHEDCLEGSL